MKDFPGGAVGMGGTVSHLMLWEIQETRVWPLGGEGPLEEEMATHSSIRAWKLPWAESLAGYSPRVC